MSGKVAYEAYRNHTGGVSLVSKQPIPEWPELRPEIQLAWDAAAKAVVAPIRAALAEIVVHEGQDAGVILLSSDSPTHYDSELNRQVYDHAYFSPLGGALVALAMMVQE